MIIHIGFLSSLQTQDIIGVFNASTLKGKALNFVNGAKSAGNFISCGHVPRAYVLAKENENTRVYESPLNTKTLNKRMLMGMLADLEEIEIL